MPGIERSCKFCDFFCACEQSQLQILKKIWENCYLRFFSVLCHVNVSHSSRTQLRSFSNLRKSQGRRFCALLAIFRNPLSYALVLCPSENQPRVTSLTVSFRSVHSTTALNCWAWGTCASFSISHFENYQTVNRGYPFFSFLFCFTKEQAYDSTLVLLTPERSNRSLSVL